MSLKSTLYSPSYRSFIERITNLAPNTLTSEVDCAANCHTKGCHLLCHDDVIGTRKVSYIIYLTEKEWKEEDGGRLELYEAVDEEEEEEEVQNSGDIGKDDGSNGDKKQFATSLSAAAAARPRRCVPGALPVKTILPTFNSLAYFVVQPGVSFHSVQEVFCDDRPRLSIQGWYHAKETPDLIENATLQRLKSTDRGEDTEGKFESLEGKVVTSEAAVAAAASATTDDTGNNISLSDDDRMFLGKYINAAYLTNKSMSEVQTKFENESSVQLRHFLLDEWNTKITNDIEKVDECDKLGNSKPALNYSVGVNDKWKAVGPAHKQRFLQYDELADDDPVSTKLDGDNDDANALGAGEYLHHLRQVLFQSAAFGQWLGIISSLGYPLGERGRIRRFRPGLDYTVAHYGVLTTNSVLDATLCFCAGDGKQCTFDEETNELVGSDDDAIWESGDVGGFECYIAADESGENDGPDAEYDEEDDTKLLSVSASNNTLSLVYRDPGTMRFVKYVGSGAPSSRYDIALEYDVEATDDTEDYDKDNDDDIDIEDDRSEFEERMNDK